MMSSPINTRRTGSRGASAAGCATTVSCGRNEEPGKIVKSHDREILRTFDSAFVHSLQKAERHEVVGAENRADIPVRA